MKQRSNWWLLCGRTEPCVSFVTGAEILPCYSESSLYTACSTRYASTARGTRCLMLRPWHYSHVILLGGSVPWSLNIIWGGWPQMLSRRVRAATVSNHLA